MSPFYDDDYRQLSLSVHCNQAGILNTGSGFLVRKGMLALCNAAFIAANVLTGAFRIKEFDPQIQSQHSRLEALMRKKEMHL